MRHVTVTESRGSAMGSNPRRRLRARGISRRLGRDKSSVSSQRSVASARVALSSRSARATCTRAAPPSKRGFVARLWGSFPFFGHRSDCKFCSHQTEISLAATPSHIKKIKKIKRYLRMYEFPPSNLVTLMTLNYPSVSQTSP